MRAPSMKKKTIKEQAVLLFCFTEINFAKSYCYFVFLLMSINRGAEEHQLVQGVDGPLHADSP